MRPARLGEVLVGFVADLVERLQTVSREPGREHGDLLALRAQRIDGFVGVGLEPFFRTEAGLEGDFELVGDGGQGFAQQPRGLVALAVIGVALAGQIALRHAMIGRDDHVRGPVQRFEMAFDRLRQRVDIGGVIAVGGHGPHGGLPVGLLQEGKALIVARCRGRAGVVRIDRRHYDLLAAQILQLLQHVGGAGGAVAHARAENHVLGLGVDAGLHGLDLIPEDQAQRAVATLVVPDFGVERRRLPGAGVEDDPAQQRLPQPGWVVDDPLVRQELREIALQARGVGRVRCAEVHQNDPDFRGFDRGVVGGQGHGGSVRLRADGGDDDRPGDRGGARRSPRLS